MVDVCEINHIRTAEMKFSYKSFLFSAAEIIELNNKHLVLKIEHID